MVVKAPDCVGAASGLLVWRDWCMVPRGICRAAHAPVLAMRACIQTEKRVDVNTLAFFYFILYLVVAVSGLVAQLVRASA